MTKKQLKEMEKLLDQHISIVGDIDCGAFWYSVYYKDIELSKLNKYQLEFDDCTDEICEKLKKEVMEEIIKNNMSLDLEDLLILTINKKGGE